MAHIGQGPRPWHRPLRALDSRVNDSFVANFCWPSPGNSQACPFPRLPGAPRVQSHLHLAENISPTIQGMAFTITAAVLQISP